MTRVLVCGGRNFQNETLMSEKLWALHKERGVSVLIHGDAEGADRAAGWWAIRNGIECDVYPAKWAEHGRAAGPIRNQLMLDEGKPDLVVAFAGHKGTAHMVMIATDAGIEVLDYRGLPGG